MAVQKKNPAAVALGRKGGKRGGPARAARLTPEQRSESARKAVQTRWARAKESGEPGGFRKRIDSSAPAAAAAGASDHDLLTLLQRIKATDNPTVIRRLSNQLERVIFHRQFENA